MIPSSSHLRQITATAVIAGSLCSCALQKTYTKAEPTNFQKSSGGSTSSKIARLPFDRSWRDPSIDPAHYSHLVIRPVSLNYLRKDQWEQSASAQLNSQGQYLSYARQVARRWDSSLQRAFRSPENHLTLTGDAFMPDTLILEIAMTEIVFNHPETYAAGMAVPGVAVADAALFAPTVAFEARVIDAATGRVVGTAGDRRGTRLRLVDLNRLTITKPNEEICDEWSQQFMQALNKDMFPIVAKRTGFSLF